MQRIYDYSALASPLSNNAGDSQSIPLPLAPSTDHLPRYRWLRSGCLRPISSRRYRRRREKKKNQFKFKTHFIFILLDCPVSEAFTFLLFACRMKLNSIHFGCSFFFCVCRCRCIRFRFPILSLSFEKVRRSFISVFLHYGR